MFLEATWAVDLYEALSELSLKPTHSHLRGLARSSIHSWSHPLGDQGAPASAYTCNFHSIQVL